MAPLLALLKNKAKHIITLTLLVVYLFSATPLYVQFFLKSGKPSGTAPTIPLESRGIYFFVDSLKPIFYNGQDLYLMEGYAFTTSSEDKTNYSIQIVLHSTHQDLAFDTLPVKRTDVTQGLPQYKKSLDNSGFRVLISKDVLEKTNYQVRVLMEGPEPSQRFYTKTNIYVERTPNRLRLVQP